MNYSTPGFKDTSSPHSCGCPKKFMKMLFSNKNHRLRTRPVHCRIYMHIYEYIQSYLYLYVYRIYIKSPLVDLTRYPAKICKWFKNRNSLNCRPSLCSCKAERWVIPVSWIARHMSMGTNQFLLVFGFQLLFSSCQVSSTGKWSIVCYGHFPPSLLNEKTLLVTS